MMTLLPFATGSDAHDPGDRLRFAIAEFERRYGITPRWALVPPGMIAGITPPAGTQIMVGDKCRPDRVQLGPPPGEAAPTPVG